MNILSVIVQNSRLLCQQWLAALFSLWLGLSVQWGRAVLDGWSERWRCWIRTLSCWWSLVISHGRRNDPSWFCTAQRAVHLQRFVGQLLLILVGLWWVIRLLLLADFLNSSLRPFYCLHWHFLKNLWGEGMFFLMICLLPANTELNLEWS